MCAQRVLRLLLRYRCSLVDLFAGIAEVVAYAVDEVDDTHVLNAIPTTDEVVGVVVHHADPVAIVAPRHVIAVAAFYVVAASTAVERVIAAVPEDPVGATFAIYDVAVGASSYVVRLAGGGDVETPQPRRVA
jgi:hypothetical protein